MRILLVAASTVSLVFAAACSGTSTLDAGGTLDLSSAHDLGGALDLGTDAGMTPVDLGAVVDAGPPDTGVHDAGPPDLGPPPFDAGPSRDVRCGSPRPAGAPLPAPLPTYSGGTCPTLMPGVENMIMSSGNARQFILVTPTTIAPGEVLPVLFMWHWLGGSANGFLTKGNVQAAADSMRFIAAIPEKKGDVILGIPGVAGVDMCWPYLNTSTAARIDEELTFFDDMLACVSSQYSIDQDCVSSVGVSAGALWTSQLMQNRNQVLANAIVLSGGIGPATSTHIVDAIGWESPPPPHAMPTLVLWGGPTDMCALNFETASHNLETALVANHSFVLECIHNCGHNVPPVEDPTLGVAALYQFAFDHPFWLNPDESPYNVRGLPSAMPTWCSIGPGTATIRTGTCMSGMSCGVPAL